MATVKYDEIKVIGDAVKEYRDVSTDMLDSITLLGKAPNLTKKERKKLRKTDVKTLFHIQEVSASYILSRANIHKEDMNEERKDLNERIKENKEKAPPSFWEKSKLFVWHNIKRLAFWKHINHKRPKSSKVDVLPYEEEKQIEYHDKTQMGTSVSSSQAIETSQEVSEEEFTKTQENKGEREEAKP